LTQDEIERFHLSILKLSYDNAVREYKACSGTRIGKLIASREIPVLRHAKSILDNCDERV